MENRDAKTIARENIVSGYNTLIRLVSYGQELGQFAISLVMPRDWIKTVGTVTLTLMLDIQTLVGGDNYFVAFFGLLLVLSVPTRRAAKYSSSCVAQGE